MRRTLLPLFVLLAPPAAAQHINHALGGTTSQSTTNHNGSPARAIDGNFDGTWANNSVTHTQSQANSWWEVQLAAAVPIQEIRLYNRADCCSGRLSNFRVRIFQGASEVDASDHFVGTGQVPAGQSYSVFPASNTVGDRVRVELLGFNNDGDGNLSLAEVEVLEYASLPQFELAQLGTASQSSIGSGGDAARAIDGNLDGYWSNGSVSHTSDQPNSWWQVDLDQRRALSMVEVHNRADCCEARLSNFRVSLLRDGVEVHGSDHFVGSGHVPKGQYLSVPVPSVPVDAVRVQLLGNNNDGNGILSLAEVRAYKVGALLSSQPNTFSVVQGGIQQFELDAGPQAAGLTYLMLGSKSGSSPGTLLDQHVLPINVDDYTLFTLLEPNEKPLLQGMGTLDALGRATAQFVIPSNLPANLAGVSVQHCFVTIESLPWLIHLPDASNATLFEMTP